MTVQAAAKEYEIEGLQGFDLPWRTEDNCKEKCQMFRDQASGVAQRLLLRHGSRNDPNTVAFDSKTKEKLRFHLSQVRAVIMKDPMPDWQKQEWFEAIAALEAQIDKSRTALVAFLEVAGKALSLSVPISEAIGKLVAIAKEAKLIEAARAMFGAPVTPKQIEGPKAKQLPAPMAKPSTGGFGGGFDKALDDKIPF